MRRWNACITRPSAKSRWRCAGNPALRHGIVLAKNGLAKSRGVRTGEALWEAEQKCPGLVTVPPHFDRYLRFSAMAREIYAEYTDQVEPFGLDECWLDVTGSVRLYGNGVRIADELRRRMREELGVTISARSFLQQDFCQAGQRLPQAGRHHPVCPRKLAGEGVPPAGGGAVGGGRRDRRAAAPLRHPHHRRPGRNRSRLSRTAPREKRRHPLAACQRAGHRAGDDDRRASAGEIHRQQHHRPRDLVTGADVRITLYSLAESVAARLREQGCRCTTVKLHVRDRELASAERQRKLPHPTGASADIADAAFALFHTLYPGEYAVRSLGVQACGLVTDRVWQTSLRPEVNRTQRAEALDNTVEAIRRRFGHASIGRGLGLRDKELVINPKEEHLIHPVSYRNG